MLHSYLRLALKVLARRKFFTFVSLFGTSFTLAVLIFASAVMDQMLAPAPPESRHDRLLHNFRVVMYGPNNTMSSNGGYLLFDRYARGLSGVERLSIYSGGESVASFLNGEKIVSTLKRTDADYWRILDFRFTEGGPFTDADVQAGRTVAVINERTRQRFFGGPAVGRAIEAGGQRFTVIGVVPDVSELRTTPFADMWVPVTTAKTDSYRRDLMGNFHALVLASDASWLPRITEEFQGRLKTVELPDPQHFDTIVAPLEGKLDALARGMPLTSQHDPGPQGWKVAALIAALTVFFSVLPIVNMVNLNVSRIMERASEIGVRKAFGASSGALVVQFVIENIVLTLVGGLVGLVLAELLLRAMTATGLLVYVQLGINWRVFGYGLVLALLFGVAAGVYPAWRMSRLHPAEALKGDAR